MSIVNEHTDMTLRLHHGIGPRCRPTIYLKTPTQEYDITYEECHREDRIRLTLMNTPKSYVLTDLSQVEMYFDNLKH